MVQLWGGGAAKENWINVTDLLLCAMVFYSTYSTLKH